MSAECWVLSAEWLRLSGRSRTKAKQLSTQHSALSTA